MINLDPSLLDQEKKRKERRKQLLRKSALPIIFLLVIAAFFLSTWAYNLIYFISYSNRNYPIAHDVTETRHLLNILEPYISSYNQGVTLMMTGDFEKAEERFTESLKNYPPEDKICKIYENLSLSIEKQADEKLGADFYGDAIGLYTNAEAVLYAQKCASKNNESGKSYSSDIARDRIVDKRESAINALNKSPDDDDSTSEGIRGKDITDQDVEKNKENEVTPNTKALGMQFIEKLINGDSYECNVKNGDMCW